MGVTCLTVLQLASWRKQVAAGYRLGLWLSDATALISDYDFKAFKTYSICHVYYLVYERYFH